MTSACTDVADARRADDLEEPVSGGPVLVARGVSVRRGGRDLLDGVSVSVERGEVLAIAGASGAGKTTLLRVLAHLQRPSAGLVTCAGSGGSGTVGPPVAFVPQDDIVHRELSVRATLRYAAALRLPGSVPRADRDRLVSDLMAELGLADRADVRVGALSGGQRKRVSIAVELLRRPDALLLDEPTTGLDPPTAAGVMALLHRLAAQGVAVVLTTHREADIEGCDRVVFLTTSGQVAFDGGVEDALQAAGVRRVSEVYGRLPDRAVRIADPAGPAPGPAASGRSRDRGRSVRDLWRQSLLLTRRSAEVMAHNRLTLAVLLGSPLLVTAMMATLFPSGSFDGSDASGLGPVQLTFWLAFAGFFFGLTYGLLQVVVERPVLERERFAGVSLGAYLASKILVLAPVLTAVAVVLLVTLRLLDRLPAMGWPTLGALLVTIVLEALSALALGLLASAAVRDAAQATLALPMLCFPQVLFAGAVVPVIAMTGPGQAMSVVLANRWGFEALARGLRLEHLDGTPAVAAHGGAFGGSVLPCWAMLVVEFLVLVAATWWMLRRTTPTPAR